MLHKACGHSFFIDYDHWNRGQRCPHCNKELKKYTDDDFLTILNKKQPSRYSMTTEYTTKRDKVYGVCNVCGNTLHMLPQYFYKGLCVYCAVNDRKEKYKLSENSVKNILGSEYETNYSEYLNNKIPINITHIKCGKSFKCSLTNFRAGARCPTCFSNKSVEELELLSFIQQHYPSAKKERINNLEIDIYIPELKIGIEFDGLYWHSNNNRTRQPKDHRKKLDALNSLGIDIINIFEDDWVFNQNETKERILKILKKENIKNDDIITLDLCEDFISNYPNYEIIEEIPPQKMYIDKQFEHRISEESDNYIYDCGKVILKKIKKE